MSDKNPWDKKGKAPDPEPKSGSDEAEMAGVKDACPFMGALPGMVPKKLSLLNPRPPGPQDYDPIIQYPACIKGCCHFWDEKHGCVIRAGLLKLAEAK